MVRKLTLLCWKIETQDRSPLALLTDHGNADTTSTRTKSSSTTQYSTHYIGVSTSSKSGKKYRHRVTPHVMWAGVPVRQESLNTERGD